MVYGLWGSGIQVGYGWSYKWWDLTSKGISGRKKHLELIPNRVEEGIEKLYERWFQTLDFLAMGQSLYSMEDLADWYTHWHVNYFVHGYAPRCTSFLKNFVRFLVHGTWVASLLIERGRMEEESRREEWRRGEIERKAVTVSVYPRSLHS